MSIDARLCLALLLSGIAAYANNAAGIAPDSAVVAGPEAPAVTPAPAAVLTKPDGEPPVSIRCGTITAVVLSSAPVTMRNLDAMLEAENYAPTGNEEDFTLIEQAPSEGKQYAIISIRLDPGRSIGRYDYLLTYGDQSFACVAMAMGDRPYDARNWQFIHQVSQPPIRLLYEIPLGMREAAVELALPARLNMPPQRLILAKAEPAAAPAAAGDLINPGAAVPQSTPPQPAQQQPQQPAAQPQQPAAAPEAWF